MEFLNDVCRFRFFFSTRITSKYSPQWMYQTFLSTRNVCNVGCSPDVTMSSTYDVVEIIVWIWLNLYNIYTFKIKDPF